jgi:hypothetical protein
MLLKISNLYTESRDSQAELNCELREFDDQSLARALAEVDDIAARSVVYRSLKVILCGCIKHGGFVHLECLISRLSVDRENGRRPSRLFSNSVIPV